MKKNVCLDKIYKPSDDVVARELQGELIIIPITSGVGDLEDAIFTLNPTGREVWNRLDGRKRLKEIAKDLACVYSGTIEEIEKDIAGLIQELLKRRILVEV